MSSFIREYVFVQNIPIVKLLFAFGISLVRGSFPPSLHFFTTILRSARNSEVRAKRRYYIFLEWQYQESESNVDVLSRSWNLLRRARLHLREKLPQYNTISDAVSLIVNSKRIMVLTGAGISTRLLFRILRISPENH